MAAEIHVLKLAEERQAAAAAVRAASIQPDMEAAVEAERARVLALVTITEQAARIGVDVDLAAVISGGMTPHEVREVVMEIAVFEKDQEHG